MWMRASLLSTEFTIAMQAGTPVFVGNDDDMNITVDVNDLQQAADATS